MPRYALLRGGKITGYRDLDNAEHIRHKVDAISDGGDGGPFARIVIDNGRPEFNDLVERLDVSTHIYKDRIEITYTVSAQDINIVKQNLLHAVERKASERKENIYGSGELYLVELLYALTEARDIIDEGIDVNRQYPIVQSYVDCGMYDTLQAAAESVILKYKEVCIEIAKTNTAKNDINLASTAEEALKAFLELQGNL